MDLQFGDFRLNRRERKVTGPGGPIEVAARSFDILEVLLARPNELIDKGALLDKVWPGVAVEENTLHVHVSALRKMLDPSYIVTVHGRGYKYAGPPPVEIWARPLADGFTRRPSAARKPVIAVLPFDNLSGDPEQQYFSDGITGDIIDRLTRYRILSVIGQHSSFALRDREAALSEARDKLQADFVLTGNVRKAANRIRIATRLTNAHTEAVLWADHFDRPLEDVFAIQDEVANIIANTLVGRLELEAGTRGPTADAASLSSYELVLQGIWHFKKLTTQSMALATNCLERAIASHPNNAEAHRYLAICYMSMWWNDFMPEGLTRSLVAAARGVELDPTSASCHQAYGMCRLYAENLDAAARSNAIALELNPGDPDILIETGIHRAFSGDLAAAHDFIGRAFRLNPLPPPWYAEFRGIVAFIEGQYAEAYPAFEAIPDCAYDNMYALACLGHLGDMQKARQITARNAASGRNWDYFAGAAREPYRDPEPRQRLVEGLRKALEA